MYFKFAKELDDVNKQLRVLKDKKDVLIRRFVFANREAPVHLFFKKLAFHGGLPAAFYWYMKVYEVGILQAKKEIYRICGKH
jgi:hypothetical protein